MLSSGPRVCEIEEWMGRGLGGMSIYSAGGLGERGSQEEVGSGGGNGDGICAGLFPTDSTLMDGVDTVAGNG